MNVLIYLGHPAQYHFFKYTIQNLKHDGHQVKVLIKTKDVLEQLLQEDGVEYTNIQPVMRKNGVVSIFIAMLKRAVQVYQIAKRFKADLLVGEDASLVYAGRILRKPIITTLEDDYEVIKREAVLSYPLTTKIVVPTVCSVGRWEKKKVGYEGYMKLAYLHPKYFTPSQEIVDSYGLKGKYCLVRLAQLTAFHDTGIKGLRIELVMRLIQLIEQYGYKVYISSESDLDEQLRPYQLRIKRTDIHHVMSGASLLVSDSQSMSVEAAMLGVPSLRFSDFSGKIRVLEELESKYQLTYGIKTNEPEKLIKKVEELMEMSKVKNKKEDGLKVEFQKRRATMLADKIDVTAFMTRFIESYPIR